MSEREFSPQEHRAIDAGMFEAYRWQYIASGVQDGRVLGVLTGLITEAQTSRIVEALGPLM